MISVNITGDQEIQIQLSALLTGLDIEAILDEATAILLARLRERFLATTDPDNVPWIPSEASIKRASTGRGGGTLFDTGNLFHSIQESASAPGERSIGTDVPYGIYLQQGTGLLPIRVFLGFGDDDIAIADQLVLTRINGILGDG
jgi:phage gpG-like protein